MLNAAAIGNIVGRNKGIRSREMFFSIESLCGLKSSFNLRDQAIGCFRRSERAQKQAQSFNFVFVIVIFEIIK